MRRAALIVLAVSAALLTSPAGAAAKEITNMRICGDRDCTRIHRSIAQRLHDHGGLPGVPVAREAVELGPYYRIVFGMGDDRGHTVGHLSSAYLPRAKAVVALDGQTDPWTRLSDRAARQLHRLTAGIAPLPARRLRAAVGELAGVHSGSLPPEVWHPSAEAVAEAPADNGFPRPLLAGVPAAALLLGFGVMWMRRRTRA